MTGIYCVCDVYPYTFSNQALSMCDSSGGINAICTVTDASIQATDLTNLGITGENIAFTLGWGIGVILFFYLSGLGVRLIKGLLNTRW